MAVERQLKFFPARPAHNSEVARGLLAGAARPSAHGYGRVVSLMSVPATGSDRLTLGLMQRTAMEASRPGTAKTRKLILSGTAASSNNPPSAGPAIAPIRPTPSAHPSPDVRRAGGYSSAANAFAKIWAEKAAPPPTAMTVYTTISGAPPRCPSKVMRAAASRYATIRTRREPSRSAR